MSRAAAYVLIAQTDRRLASWVARHLEDEGFQAVISRDGTDAAGLLDSRGLPDLLITDLSLTGLDGFALLTRLRARAPLERVPALVLSAFAHLREAAFEHRHLLGVSASLPATVSWDALRRSISRARLNLRPEGRAPRDLEAEGRVDNAARAARLDQLGLAPQAKPVPSLQVIAVETARRLNAPSCFVSVVVGGRTYLKAAVNLPPGLGGSSDTPLRWTFCQQLTEAAHPLVVSDATAHPAFAAEPVVQEGLVRSYLGVPVTTSDGVVVGALGVVDSKPRQFTTAEVDELTVVARRVAAELELSSPTTAESPFAAEEYFRAALAHMPIGVLFVGPNHRLAFANSRAADLLGIPVEELGRVSRTDVVARLSKRGALPHDLEELLRAPSGGPYVETTEIELVRPSRQVLRWSSRPVPLRGEVGQLVLIEDITRERDLLEERERLARTDALTGLGNRRNAEEAIAREVMRSQRNTEPLAFILFDIDHFKRVNDTFGHAAGDQALRMLGEIFRKAFRGFDLASRWGGEEFLIVLPGADLHRAHQIADRVRSQVERTPVAGVGPITISAGVSELGADETAEEAIGRADEKLYEAKAAGRNRIA